MIHGDATLSVPKNFVSLAKSVALCRDPAAFRLLYSLLWQIQTQTRETLANPLHPEVLQARRIEKAVKRDIHKMHAFVRFRRTEGSEGDHFIAFHRPDHYIVHAATPFFVRRFKNMLWTIETPDAVARWDLNRLTFHPGVDSPSIASDPFEEDWQTYYKAIANPARLKLKMMKKEMPTRHWDTLPETKAIQELLREAQPRVEEMLQRNPPAAQPHGRTIDELKEDSLSCQACPLHSFATQTVFGEGPSSSRLVLVGEQAGDEEDKEGRPFIGPAGQVLNRALRLAGINRSSIYLTNAVKHFKFEHRGKVRLHKKPDGREVNACKPWLFAELSILKPKVIICLGATAAQSLLGRSITIKDEMLETFTLESGSLLLITYHPSAILRAPAEKAEEYFLALLNTLERAQTVLTKGLSPVEKESEATRR